MLTITLLLTIALPVFTLEEQRYQARVIVNETKTPHWIFPLPEANFFYIEKQFMESQDKREYISWESTENISVIDLCGIQEIVNIPPKGEENLNA